MVVQPHFFHHWKTQTLITATGDPAAPLCILKLWGHCQNVRSWEFENLSDVQLAGICEWKGDPHKFRSILRECKFIEEQGDTTAVHDWDKVNASLIAAWNRGKYGELGGRPPTVNEESETSKVTSMVPSMGTLEEPDKIRLDKTGLDKKSVLREEKPVPKVPKHPKVQEQRNAAGEYVWRAEKHGG